MAAPLVVLLRGVNVGGHKTFKPTELARKLRRFDPVNIGAAGTFVIRKPGGVRELRAEIAKRLPFESEIVICKGREILDLLARDPFGGEKAGPEIVRFVTVLTRSPKTEPPLPLRLPSRGTWLLNVVAREGRYVFGRYRRHMKVIGYLGMLDRLFGVPTTTRNWNTLEAIGKVLAE